MQLAKGLLGVQKKHLAYAGGGKEAGRVQRKTSKLNLKDECEGPGQEKASWAPRGQVALARAAWTRDRALTWPELLEDTSRLGEPDHRGTLKQVSTDTFLVSP